MVFRWLFHYLVNNEQLINRLADSYPVRKAARLVVNMFVIGRDTFGKLTGPTGIAELYCQKLLVKNVGSCILMGASNINGTINSI
ncbi:Mediator of RNA polymerase II transcription subunit 9 [Gryllus bimaculatus]|nr:Mediator of RNA polymerase II transcription subunit 9 [Gryllus bimaculatus]